MIFQDIATAYYRMTIVGATAKLPRRGRIDSHSRADALAEISHRRWSLFIPHNAFIADIDAILLEFHTADQIWLEVKIVAGNGSVTARTSLASQCLRRKSRAPALFIASRLAAEKMSARPLYSGNIKRISR